MFSSRSLVLAVTTLISTLAAPLSPLQAGCCGLFGGGWGSNYAPYSYYGYSSYYPGYYGDAYYSSNYAGGSYYGGYGPSDYGGCSSCGAAGCASCSPAVCAPCTGGNCGVTQPYSPTPTPEDGFKTGPGGTGKPPARGGTGGDSGRNTFRNEQPGAGADDARKEGFDSTRGRAGRRGGETNDDVDSFETPEKSDSKGFGANKPAVTDGADQKDADKQETNRPDLGKATESIIQKRERAPLPEPPGVDSQAPEKPADANQLNLDDKKTNSAVIPKSRLAVRQKIDAPRIVRLRVRPNQTWIAVPQPPVLAQQ